MTRASWLDSPLLVGFGHMQELAERAARGSDGYPPYNIEDRGEAGLRVTLAVAGFAPDDLTTTVEGRQLVVRGRRAEADAQVYLHRGIAARRFQRAFVLADGHEVDRAMLENGLLHIDIRRTAPEDTVTKIAIETGAGG